MDNGIGDVARDAERLTMTQLKVGRADVSIETRAVDHPGNVVRLNSATIILDEAGLRALADWLRRRGY